MIFYGGREFEPPPGGGGGAETFSLCPSGPISFLGLSLRRFYLGYCLEHFNLPHLNHYIHFEECLNKVPSVVSGQFIRIGVDGIGLTVNKNKVCILIFILFSVDGVLLKL